ncbi:hypothetical protein ACIHDR_09270 [Nocardia sp. NPDC052278]
MTAPPMKSGTAGRTLAPRARIAPALRRLTEFATDVFPVCTLKVNCRN